MEITVRDVGELEKAIFSGVDVETMADPVEAQKAILRRVFAAETPEELETVGATNSWQELLGVPIEVHEVRLMSSAFEEGSRVYAIVEGIRMDEGKPVVLTCGGINVLAKLIKAKAEGWLPLTWKLVQAERPSASGFYPLWLVSP